MDKILIVFGIAAVALVCAIIVKKARREFSFAPDAHAATDERKLPAPDKTAILRRTQCVGVLVRRGLAEIALAEGQGDAAIHLAAVKALEKWTRARGLHGGFGTYELDLITGLAGTWGTEDARWAVRGTEGLGCLCWALSLLREMPPYDKSFDVAALLGYLHAGEENFDLNRATTLRTFDALLRERQRADVWRWRLDVQQRIERHRKPPRGFSYPQLILMAAKSAVEQGVFAVTIDDDFPACGKAFGKIAPDESARLEALITARAGVLDWLCGYAPTPGGPPRAKDKD